MYNNFVDNLKENFIKNIQEAALYENPFDHLYIENFFENSFYEKVQKNIPDINDYEKIADTGRVGENYSQSRYILDLQKDIKKLNNDQQVFWNNINNIFSSI